MKRTKWYNGYQKPVRVGYYERDYWLNLGEELTVTQCYWNGTTWGLEGTDLVYTHQHLPWRGLTKEAK
jgi:hypothetical protein